MATSRLPVTAAGATTGAAAGLGRFKLAADELLTKSGVAGFAAVVFAPPAAAAAVVAGFAAAAAAGPCFCNWIDDALLTSSDGSVMPTFLGDDGVDPVGVF